MGGGTPDKLEDVVGSVAADGCSTCSMSSESEDEDAFVIAGGNTSEIAIA